MATQTVSGSAGNDTIAFSLSGSTVSVTGATPSSFPFVAGEDDVIVNLLGGTDSLTLGGVTPVTVVSTGSVAVTGSAGADRVTVRIGTTPLAASIFQLGAGIDTLVAGSDITSFDLRSTTISGVEVLSGSSTTGTNFILGLSNFTQGDTVVDLGTIEGSTGNDTLTFSGARLDLTSTTLTSIETLAAGSSGGTEFVVNQADVPQQVVGNAAGTDTLTIAEAQLNLSGTTLSSIEVLAAGSSAATIFTLDVNDIGRLAGGSIRGGESLADELRVGSNDFNLGNIQVSGVEVLASTATSATLFRIDQADLASGGSIIGIGGQTDTVSILGTSLDLTSTTLTSVERLTAANFSATTFVVDASDIAELRQVIGNAGADTLRTVGAAADLRNLTLISIERVEVGSGTPVGQTAVLNVGAAFLSRARDVAGVSNADRFEFAGNPFDLTLVALSGFEVIWQSRHCRFR